MAAPGYTPRRRGRTALTAVWPTVLAVGLALLATGEASSSGTRQVQHTAMANCVLELSFTSRKLYADPFNDVDLDVVFTAPDGRAVRVPAFWDGGQTWRVRYASGQLGAHRFRTECTDASNPDLNGIRGSVEITPYVGRNPLYRHGPIRVAGDRRHFAYADGTPFFWLGDTWWMGLCKRLRWPGEFKTLTRDRARKGFTVVQIVAGLYPDMPAFDERGANEAGFPWTRDYARIEPGYFDAADRRIECLVRSGIVPCVVGAWGYHLPWMGVKRMEQHWRYLIARYAAYTVVWCVAGEANLPYYLVKGFPFDDRAQVAGWTEVARYVRATDPWHRLVSIHPTGLGRLCARGAIDDVSLLDFDMLQTGHGDRASLGPTVDAARTSYAATPVMPFVNAEVCYEGILNSCHADVQRLMFWACMLCGAAGHTYGANGIWQLNRRGEPYGKSPHGGTYGPMPWDEAMALPGSTELGWAKRFLTRLPWQKFKPHPEWAAWAQPAAPPASPDDFMSPYCAGIAGRIRLVYLPAGGPVRIQSMEPSVRYRATWLDPATGKRTAAGAATGDAACEWRSPAPPDADHDWLLLLERSAG